MRGSRLELNFETSSISKPKPEAYDMIPIFRFSLACYLCLAAAAAAATGEHPRVSSWSASVGDHELPTR